MTAEKQRKSRSRRKRSGRSSSTRTLKTTSRYTSLNKIGSGGIGTVYRAEASKLDRTVAVKEINAVFDIFAHLEKADIVGKLEAIVKKQAGLNHPNVAQIVDFDTKGEYPFIVTEYAASGNLRRLIDQNERPSLEFVLKYFIQILSALKQAHEDGLYHGNLKPENVLLDSTGNAIISDFGLSSILDRKEQQNNQVYVGVGTVAYLSPEQFQNPNQATVQTDIYSLGIMFYELLTGKLPGRRSPMPSNLFPEIPKTFDDIFDQMCRDDASDRYESVEAIFDELYGADEVLELINPRTGYTFLESPVPEVDVEEVDSADNVDTTDESSSERSEASAGSSRNVSSNTNNTSRQATGNEDSDPDISDADFTGSDESSAANQGGSDANEGFDKRTESQSGTSDDSDTADDGISADDVASKLDEYEDMFD